jgi:CBS domain-containing protein
MDLPDCTGTCEVQEALERMIRSGRYKCLVTDEDNRLIGIISVMDLLGAELPLVP